MSRAKRRPPFARLGFRFNLLAAFACCLAFLALASTWSGAPARAEKRSAAAPPTVKRQAAKADVRAVPLYGRLPLRFEPNRGQADPSAQFVVRGAGYEVSLAGAEAVLRMGGASEPLRMRVVGTEVASRSLQGRGLEPLGGVSNYFLGSDPAKWLTRVPHFARVRYESVYEGVDLEYYGNLRRLEYDFRVAAGADPSRIALGFDGARRVRVGEGGDLFVSTRGGGDVRLLKPVAYQLNEDGARVEVAARYQLERGRVRFRLGSYDRTRELVIDPCVEYATFLGGAADDRVLGVAVNAQGQAYVAGLTTSSNFPGAPAALSGASDAFVAKLSADGSTLLWATYYGGSGNEDARGLAVDAAGNAYITGITDSLNLPTVNAFQPSKGSTNNFIDAYVAKLDAGGAALAYSTYLGGWRPDIGQAVAVDSTGAAYVTGNTGSYDTGNPTLRTFPVTAGAYQTDFPFLTEGGGNSAAFVTKLSPAGGLAYSTFLGGLGRATGSTNGDADPDDTGFGIAVNANGEAYVSGRTESERFPSTAAAVQASYGGGLSDAFVTGLDATGSSLLYSTFLGGASEENRSLGAVALDPAGNVYAAGSTNSTNFPTLNPVTAAYSGGAVSDAYATKLSPAGGFVYSTYLGTNNFSRAFGVAADAGGNAYVAGTNALRKLDAGGALARPSHTLGGEGRGVALDAQGGVYVGGITTTTSATKCTSATQFCPTAGAFQQNPGGSTNDGFVLKFEGEEDTVEIAGFVFPREALADDAVQTKAGIDATAQFCSRIDYAGTTIAQRVKSALTDGCPATSTLGDAEFEATFIDNRVVNEPGEDIAVFEIGSGAGNEPFSVSVFYNGQFTAPITYTPQPTTFFDCANLRINVARIDLADFGLPAGAQVSRLRFDNLFVPNVTASGAEIADIAAIHSAPPSCAPVVPTSWWRAEGTAEDAVGPNDGTLHNGAGFAPGLVGQAFRFDGVDDYVQVLNSPSLSLSGPHTLEFWFKPSVTHDFTTPRSPGFFSKGPNDSIGLANTDNLPGGNDGTLEVRGPVPRPFTTTNSWLAGNWYHAAVTFDGAGYKVYVNGVLEASVAGTHSILDNPYDVMFGTIPGFAPNGVTFAGLIDEMALYNRALSAAEVNSIYEAAGAGKCEVTNRAPTADAGPDQVVEATGATTNVTLDGSASSDPDGDALAYEWRDSSNNVVGNTALVNLQLGLGMHTFTLRVDDGKGGTDTDDVAVVVRDTTAPAVNCGAADGQWHNADVAVACTASDAASGLVNTSDASFTLSTNVPAVTEDANASTDSRQVCDNAGNCSTAGPVSGNKVDKKAPDINITSPTQGASYTLGQQVAASYTCADGGSGVAVCAGTVASGASIDTASVGPKSFTVVASDAAGNTATKTVTYSVGYNVCVLYYQTKAHKSGSTIPVKLRLCGPNGENLSAAGITLTALGTVRLSDFAPGEVEDAGQANPDDNFRYDAGVGGYIFNLQTKGLMTGTYVLVLKAGADPLTHGVQFQIK